MFLLRHSWQRRLSSLIFSVVLGLSCLLAIAVPTALAELNDDHFDGNIFALYAGNGSLIPPRVSLADSLKRTDRPTMLFLYVDDSRDCKQYASVISQLQAFYGRVADFIPISADAIPVKSTYAPTEPGYYYKGVVPQTVVFNQAGKIVLNEKGVLKFEQVDDVLRQVFDLLPRSESVELRRRVVNEINTELVPSKS